MCLFMFATSMVHNSVVQQVAGVNQKQVVAAAGLAATVFCAAKVGLRALEKRSLQNARDEFRETAATVELPDLDKIVLEKWELCPADDGGGMLLCHGGKSTLVRADLHQEMARAVVRVDLGQGMNSLDQIKKRAILQHLLQEKVADTLSVSTLVYSPFFEQYGATRFGLRVLFPLQIILPVIAFNLAMPNGEQKEFTHACFRDVRARVIDNYKVKDIQESHVGMLKWGAAAVVVAGGTVWALTR